MNILENIYKTDGGPIIIERREPINKFNDIEKNMYKINNVTNLDFAGPAFDGLQINGDITAFVNNFIASNTHVEPDAGDECASVVNGADVIFTNCVFADNGKAVLQGSGDSNLEDIRRGTRTIFYNCIFMNCSRRSPFINAGQSLVIDSLVMNWGKHFHEKSFGIRAGSHAQITVIGTIFLQESLSKCIKRGHLFKDTFGHYFWPFWIGPGFRRAAYADWNGQIVCYDCYKNRSWLYLKNHRGRYMDKDDAETLLNKLKSLHPGVIDDVEI